MAENKYSKNPRAEKLMGLRPEGIPIDFPEELGYLCPRCGKKHTLQWSEYKSFIWCEACNEDFPSPLCMPDLKRATEIFLDVISDGLTRAAEKITKETFLEAAEIVKNLNDYPSGADKYDAGWCDCAGEASKRLERKARGEDGRQD